MKLSVVTITYRDQEGLRKTLESLRPLLLSDVEWEQVVVDSSPEENANILSALPGHWPLKHCIEPARGIYAAMNSGISQARGEWVWLLNGGDRLNSVEVLKECLVIGALHTETDLICGGGSLFRSGVYLYDRLPRRDFLSSITGRNHLCHQGILYRRESMMRVGAFSEKLKISSDYEHHVRCYIAGLKAYMVPKSLAECELGGASDDYLLSLRECREVINSLRGKLPEETYRKLRRAQKFERARLFVIKGLATSPFKKMLRPLWLVWNRLN